MSRRVFAHIGLPKTGTSYLKAIAWPGRDRLRGAGLLLRRAEALDGAGAILLTAHARVLAEIGSDWIAELARRTGRTVRMAPDQSLAIGPGHAQIVPL